MTEKYYKYLFFYLLYVILPENMQAQGIRLRLSQIYNTNIPTRVGLFSEDSLLVAWSEVSNNEVHVMRRPDFYQITILNSDQRGVKSFHYHPTLPLIAVGNYMPIITIWEIEPRNLRYSLKGHTDDVNHVQFDPTGNFLASASHDQTIKTWDFKQEKVKLELLGHEDIIKGIKYSSKGDLLFSIAHDGKLLVWNTNDGSLIKCFQLEGMLQSIDVAKNDQLVVTANDKGEIYLVDILNEKVEQFKAHGNVITSLSLTPDNKILFSAGWDKKIKAWDLKSRKLLLDTVAHKDYVFSIDVSPEGDQLISTSRDKQVKFWDILFGE